MMSYHLKNFTMAAKFLTRRALNIEAVTRTFSPLWRSVKGFEVRRSNDRVLLFTFEKKEEVERIMSNAPWSFNKHLVVLQWYDKEVPLKDLVFDKFSIWVQIHDVPLRFMNKAVAEKLCAVVGTVWKDIDEGETDGGSFLRMKCECLNHGDRDCDLWIESEGNLTKESQAYGAWIRAAPFVKGRNPVVKSDTAEVIAKLIKSGGRESRERFEERLKEIDMEMDRFDKMRGVFSGDNLEEEIVGIKDQKPTRKADESIQKLDDRHAENSNRHAENVASTEGFSQSRVHEANLC
uniref:DUF4283 domain-containing protein n=1 Tax=Quercus lobata TaxID=97700 RepID=A0A7N2MKT8_QUELO